MKNICDYHYMYFIDQNIFYFIIQSPPNIFNISKFKPFMSSKWYEILMRNK